MNFFGLCLIGFYLNIICLNQVTTYQLKSTYYGHNGTVRALVILDNGFLVSGADDFSIKVWDNKNEKLIQTFNKNNNGHSNQIRRLIKLKNNHVVSVSLDSTVKVWNFSKESLITNESASLVYSIDSTNGGHSGPVISAALIEDGYYYLATGSADRQIKIWDLSNLKNIILKYTLIGHTDIISSLVSLKNGLLASSSHDKKIKIWDINSGNLKYTFDETNGGHQDPIDYLALANNGYLVSSSSNYQVSPGVIKVWNITNAKLKYTFDLTNGGHNGSIFDLISLKNGYLASASEDKTIKIWDVIEGKLIKTFDRSNGGHMSIVWSLISIDNDLMASGAGEINTEYGELKIWNLKTNKLEYTFDKSNGGHSSRVYSFVLLDNGDFMSGSVDKTIKKWLKNSAKKYGIEIGNILFIISINLIFILNK